jgi:hypothetical protein
MDVYRHGDVLISPVEAIPEHAVKQSGLTLARGELTGHAHKVETDGLAELYVHEGNLFHRVVGSSARVVHEEHHPIELSDCPQIDFLPEWLTVTSSIDVANTGLNGLPTWFAKCELLWRGVRVDERIVFRPETITAEEIVGERNAERRRVMLERMGLERFFRDVRYEVLDADRGGDRQLLNLRFDDEDLRVLAVTCPSTRRNYFIRVPPFVNGCHEAAAWIAGFDNPDEYRPVVDT